MNFQTAPAVVGIFFLPKTFFIIDGSSSTEYSTPTDKIAKSCLLEFLNLARDKTMQASRGGATQGAHRSHGHHQQTPRHCLLGTLHSPKHSDVWRQRYLAVAFPKDFFFGCKFTIFGAI